MSSDIPMDKIAKDQSERSKWAISAWVALLFVLLSAPLTYKMVNKLTDSVGLSIADSNGAPNWKGLAVHAVVFALALRAVMEVPLPGV